jgi:phosphohistidine phosphatase
VKRLFVLRHAKSDWGQAGLADHDRHLAPRGERAAAAVAGHLRRARVEPDVVLCSTATRARETFERVHGARPDATPVWFERRLYGAGADELIERLNELPDSDGSVMLVGHNPGLQDLVLALAPAADAALVARAEAKFPTAALATVDLAVDRWTGAQPGTGTLVAYVTPRDLG